MPEILTREFKDLIHESNPVRTKKFFNDFELKQVDREQRQIRGIFNKLAVDRDGEVLLPAGCRYEAYMQNPVGMFNHLNRSLPVFQTLEINASEKELEALIEFYDKDENPLAENLFLLYSRGKMRAFSHWFMPKVWTDETVLEGQTGRTYVEWELLEISCVTVPALREALVSERSPDPVLIKAFEEVTGEEFSPENKKEEQKTVVPVSHDLDREKRVVPFKSYPAENTSWYFSARDGNAIIAQGGWKLYRDIHTWYNPEAGEGNPPEVRLAYKLPHHKLIGGAVKTVWRGVATAMGILLGARGGIQIPDNERRGTYNHLARHYKEFEKPVPDFKDYSTKELNDLFGWLDDEELKAVQYAWEDALVPPYKARVIEFPSLEAAQKAIAVELKEAMEAITAGREVSAAEIEKIRLALEASSRLIKDLNQILEGAKPDKSAKELLTIIDLFETMKRCADMLSKFNTLHP